MCPMSLKLLINQLQSINDKKTDSEEKFKNAIITIRDFMSNEFYCKEYEVSLMLKDEDDQVHFVLPITLFEKGNTFPLQTSKITRKIIEMEKSILENDTRDTLRLSMYERLKDAGKESMPIQKFIAVPVSYNDIIFGAIWVNRRAKKLEEAGPDFSQTDLDKLNHYMRFIAPLLYKLRLKKFI